jgi:hypothetical protein
LENEKRVKSGTAYATHLAHNAEPKSLIVNDIVFLTRHTLKVSKTAILGILEAGICAANRLAFRRLAGPVTSKLGAFGIAAPARGGVNDRVAGRKLGGAAFATGAALIVAAAVSRIGFVRTAALYHPSFLPDATAAVI